MGLDFNLLGIRQPSQGLLPERGPGQELFAAQTQRRAQDINLFNIQANAQLRQQELAEQQRANIMQELDRAQGREAQKQNLAFEKLKHYDDMSIREETLQLMIDRLNFDKSRDEFDREITAGKLNLEEKRFLRETEQFAEKMSLEEARLYGDLDYKNRLAAVQEAHLNLAQDSREREFMERQVLSQAIEEGGVEGYKLALQKLGRVKESFEIEETQAKISKHLHEGLKKQDETSLRKVGKAMKTMERVNLELTKYEYGSDEYNAALYNFGNLARKQLDMPVTDDLDTLEAMLDFGLGYEAEVVQGLVQDMKSAENQDTFPGARSYLEQRFDSQSDASKEAESEFNVAMGLPRSPNAFQQKVQEISSRKSLPGSWHLAQKVVDTRELQLAYSQGSDEYRKKVDETATFGTFNKEALERIESRFKPEVLNSIVQGVTWIAKKLERVGVTSKEGKDLIYKQANLLGETGRFLTAYVKDISGVAVSEAEYLRLMKQTFGGDLDAVTFEVNLANMIELAVRDINRARRSKGTGVLEMPAYVKEVRSKYEEDEYRTALEKLGRGDKYVSSSYTFDSEESALKAWSKK